MVEMVLSSVEDWTERYSLVFKANTVTGMKRRREVSIRLAQNFPNPFGKMVDGSATTVEYDLPIAEFVRLSDFDLLGREVRTSLHPGRHRVSAGSPGTGGPMRMKR